MCILVTFSDPLPELIYTASLVRKVVGFSIYKPFKPWKYLFVKSFGIFIPYYFGQRLILVKVVHPKVQLVNSFIVLTL